MSVRAAISQLERAGVPSAEHDARTLARYAESTGADFTELVRRRADRVPLQHLTGSVGFRYIDLDVGAGVFVPRPETEVVAGVAIDLARAAGEHPVVVDLCSGSGAIALSVAHEVPSAQVHAVELDSGALRWLARNAASRRAAGDSGIGIHQDDVRQALPELDGSVDVVVSNPPYVAEDEIADVDPEVRDHDPRVALVAGGDGLDVIRLVAATAHRLLRPGGWVVVEHSDRQGESAPAALSAAGFLDVADAPDLTGRPRLATGRRP
ncbi:MAG: release factor glutamine methyltransferase [Frankiaceae bacterium]|jgi:release factor glutamine methyltransferase|nr:release factor glutamine methyltransferase [Frankiaceae bacterium]